MHQFNEHHPALKGFSAFYDAEFHPLLLADEAQRLRELKRFKEVTFMTATASAVILSLFVYVKLNPPWPVYLIISGLCLIVVAINNKSPKMYVGFKTKKNIVGGIRRYLGWTYETDLAISPHIDFFKSLGLITSRFEREVYEDRMSGQVHGANFEFYEAHLLKRHKSSQKETWKTTFRGQLLVLKFERKSFGRTVVLRDKGIRNPKVKDGMKRVGLVDQIFEKIYEAYGTDQVEARYLLTSTFMQRLVNLEHSVDWKNMRFGFMGSYLLIAIETGNRYESGSMFKPLIDTGRTQKVLDEIGAIYDVIDGVIQR